MTNKLTSVWFAFAGDPSFGDEPEPAQSVTDLTLIPYDSYESALWALRADARYVWESHSNDAMPDFSVMDEITIRDTLANAAEDHDDVLVEIREVQIINHTGTGWRTLDLKAADDALRATPPVPPHHFQSGLSCNNEVTRCVVTHNGKDHFGPWRGDEASALKAALLMIQERG